MANARFMYWNGMNTARDLSAKEFQKFNDFYTNVHIHEVVAMNRAKGVQRRVQCFPDRGDYAMPRSRNCARAGASTPISAYTAALSSPISGARR